MGRIRCCAGRSEFFLRAEPERSEGGWSEEMKNREGVASGGAMVYYFILIVDCFTIFDIIKLF